MPGESALVGANRYGTNRGWQWHPTLPRELEREIFEIAAFSNRSSIPKLLLIARRVKIWIEPILYNVFVIDKLNTEDSLSADQCNNILNSKPPSFVRDHVHHLAMVYSDHDPTLSILSKCSGAADLLFFSDYDLRGHPTFLSSLAAMSLRRLSVYQTFSFDSFNSGDSILGLITHLHIHSHDFTDPNKSSLQLGRLPRLTHFSVRRLEAGPFLQDPNYQRRFFDGVLIHCKSLEVLVVIHSDWYDWERFRLNHHYFDKDPRSVIVTVPDMDDWENGATGGEDHWIKAERFIQKRRSGEVKSSRYCVPDSDDDSESSDSESSSGSDSGSE
ncbi:hypothetical protein B0H13DRAFT_2070556 [Mycena leptocephala]|nr:hypothetical protein B0H13DRAFT_2070556 [Mycena leptocephala]